MTEPEYENRFETAGARNSAGDQYRELRKLAYLYHAIGNYAKADEILAVIEKLESRNDGTNNQEAA